MAPLERVHWQALFAPKRGHSIEEYEDAFASDPARGRFAIADGATESSFAGFSARLLVTAFIRKPVGLSYAWKDWLPVLQRLWRKQVGAKPLPWYAETKVQQGAFATFLGLVLEASEWRAIAVGDSCLFHIRAGQLLQAFPVQRSEDFGNTPALVGSQTVPPETVERWEVRAVGDWKVGDWLLLMTDALAQWFLSESEAGRRPWEAVRLLLEGPPGSQTMAAWIEPLRQQGRLRNDDVTLIAVRFMGEV